MGYDGHIQVDEWPACTIYRLRSLTASMMSCPLVPPSSLSPSAPPHPYPLLGDIVVHLTVVMLALGLVLFERDMTVVAVKEPNLHSERRVKKRLARHRMYALSRWVHSALGVLVLDT